MTTLPSIRELLADVFRNIRLIVIALVIPPLIAVAVSMLLKPVYQADAKLLIKPGREYMPNSNLGQSDQGAPASSMQEIVKSEIEILNSSDLAQDVLSKLTISGVFPGLSSKDADPAAQDKAVALFGKQLDATPIELSNVVSVSFKSADSHIATKVLQTLLADFQARHVTLYSAGLTGPIQEQIAEKQKQIQDLDSQRIAYQNANGAFSIPEQRASLIQQRAQIASLLQDAEIKSEALQQQITFLTKSRANTPKSAPIDTEIDPTSSNTAVAQLMTLKQKEQELLQHYQPTAPAVLQIQSQIADTEQLVQSTQSSKVRTGANPLLASIDQQLLTTQSELAPISSQVNGYKGQAASLDDQLRKLQDNELQVNNLQRQIDSMTAELQNLRANLEQARMADDMDEAKVSSISVIDAPRLESKPVFPKKTVFALGGLGLGFALSMMIILVSLTFGNTIITTEGAERILNAPVVAALPKLKGLAAE
ncbi:MAG TPA: Wzz/FepE/Etk N-terminal domain-containing protein [Dongiaceae bacterium]|jgi:uncharacterized protein involved in exopolysaccharide biosynthesis